MTESNVSYIVKEILELVTTNFSHVSNKIFITNSTAVEISTYITIMEEMRQRKGNVAPHLAMSADTREGERKTPGQSPNRIGR